MNLLKNKKALKRLLKHGDVLNTLNGGHVQADMSIKQHQKEFLIVIKAPGISVEQFDLTLDFHRLNVNINIPHDFRDAAIYHPVFSRVFNLPGYVDVDQIEAHYEPGMLQVVLPFKELDQNQRRKINIQHL
jgi:HSP20 family molecular chaperone IbpA